MIIDVFKSGGQRWTKVSVTLCENNLICSLWLWRWGKEEVRSQKIYGHLKAGNDEEWILLEPYIGLLSCRTVI